MRKFSTFGTSCKIRSVTRHPVAGRGKEAKNTLWPTTTTSTGKLGSISDRMIWLEVTLRQGDNKKRRLWHSKVAKLTVKTSNGFHVQVPQEVDVEQVQVLWYGLQSKASKQQVDFNSIHGKLEDRNEGILHGSEILHARLSTKNVSKRAKEVGPLNVPWSDAECVDICTWSTARVNSQWNNAHLLSDATRGRIVPGWMHNRARQQASNHQWVMSTISSRTRHKLPHTHTANIQPKASPQYTGPTTDCARQFHCTSRAFRNSTAKSKRLIIDEKHVPRLWTPSR